MRQIHSNYSRLSRCLQLGGLVPVLCQQVPLRYNACKSVYSGIGLFIPSTFMNASLNLKIKEGEPPMLKQLEIFISVPIDNPFDAHQLFLLSPFLICSVTDYTQFFQFHLNFVSCSTVLKPIFVTQLFQITQQSWTTVTI